MQATMKRILTLMLILLLAGGARGQRVGVVFSGGGAKGLYHVGILKALEENNIPIDYVSGASMGAIVAGMYAAGYSPDEMIRFFITDTVQHWLSAKSSDLDNNYYFKKFEPSPTMVSVKIDPKAVKSSAIQLPTNIVSPYQLDLAFVRMLFPASAAAGNDFDSLMVPFRCNASDVYNKETVVFDRGSLPFAIRASMTIPLVFKPLTQDTVVLFDGGLYDNFPWQPLDTAFRPDILIGGICASNYENPSADNIVQQVSVMATSKTDYELPDSLDVEIRRRFKEIGVLDYDKASYIIARGYEDAMRQMPLIRERIARRVSDDEITAKREAFKKKIEPLVFEQIDVEGLTPKQTAYVYRQLGLKPRQLFDMEYFERKYMQVLAGGVFTGEFPEVTYNPKTGFFRLKLTMHTQASMQFSLGGNISSTSMNQAYVGLEYRRIGKSSQTYNFDGYFSPLYTSLSVRGRTDFFARSLLSLDYGFNFNYYNYFKSNFGAIGRRNDLTYSKYFDTYATAALTMPIGRYTVLSLRANGGWDTYRYFQTTDYEDDDYMDQTRFPFFGLKLEVDRNGLNYLLYPTRGIRQSISAIFITGNEMFRPGTRPPDGVTYTSRGGDSRHWFGAQFLREHYYPVCKWFSFGYLLQAVLTNHPTFTNEYATNITSPAFTPTPHSKFVYIKDFRSSSFIGLGLMPTFEFGPKFYLKNSFYLFLPNDHNEVKENIRKRVRFIYNSSLVYQTPVGPVSLTVSKYDATNRDNWFLTFNFGFTIFNRNGLFY